MARGGWPGRLRLRHRERHPDPALPRAAARRDHAADRARRPGQRPRGLAGDGGRALRAELAALRPRRRLPGRAGADHGLPRATMAAVDLPHRGRHGGQPGGGRLPRARRRRPALAPALAPVGRFGRGWGPVPQPDRPTRPPQRPAAALGPRLPRAAPREPGLRLRRRGHRRARPLAALSGHSTGLDRGRRHVPPRARVVPQLPIRYRARARPRLRRGSRLAGRVQLDPERARGDDDAERGRDRAGRGPRLPFRHGSEAPPALHFNRAAERRCLRRAARPGQDHRRRLSLVHRLGARHLHHAARFHDPARRAGSGAPDPARLGRCGLRGHAAEPLSRFRRAARVQRGRRLALVRGRGARVPARRAPAAGAGRAGGGRGAGAGGRADPRGLSRRHPLRHPHGRGRPDRGRGARRAADLDGRQGRRLGGDAPDRQAGRGPGTLAERAQDRPRHLEGLGRDPLSGARLLPATLLERAAGLSLRRGRRRSRAGQE